MHSTRRSALITLILVALIGVMAACKSDPPPPPKEIDFKTAEKESDTVVESVIPTPDQIFLAMSTLGKPKWDGAIATVDKSDFGNESQTAIVAGFHLAHFFIYVHTKDKDNADKAVDRIVASAKALKVKVSKKDLKELRDNVKAGKWDDLRFSLSTFNGKMTDQLMEDMKRPDLVTLISLGAWLEGAHIASTVLTKKYSKKSAVVLQQHDLIKDVRKAVKKTLKDDDKYAKIIIDNMGKLQKLMKTDGGKAPAEDKVKEINELTTKTRGKILG